MEIVNREARYNYTVLDTYDAGLVLQGTEIKSIRQGKANIKDSYAIVRDNEMWILNMHISLYKEGNIFNHDVLRTRKLLLHKQEIKKIAEEIKNSGYTLIPLKLYFRHGMAKILIGVCKGKKNYDKKQSIKERDIERYNKKEYKI